MAKYFFLLFNEIRLQQNYLSSSIMSHWRNLASFTKMHNDFFVLPQVFVFNLISFYAHSITNEYCDCGHENEIFVLQIGSFFM